MNQTQHGTSGFAFQPELRIDGWPKSCSDKSTPCQDTQLSASEFYTSECPKSVHQNPYMRKVERGGAFPKRSPFPDVPGRGEKRKFMFQHFQTKKIRSPIFPRYEELKKISLQYFQEYRKCCRLYFQDNTE